MIQGAFSRESPDLSCVAYAINAGANCLQALIYVLIPSIYMANIIYNGAAFGDKGGYN